MFGDACFGLIVHRWWWTRWSLFAASCVQCPAQPPRDSARLSHPFPNKSPSLAPPSGTPSWREQRRILTEPWSKKESWWNTSGPSRELQSTYWFVIPSSVFFLCSPLFREVKLSVVSYLTNSIVDQILQELYTTHKTLVLVISLYCMTSFVEM